LLSRTSTCKEHSFRVQVDELTESKVLTPTRNDGVVAIDFNDFCPRALSQSATTPRFCVSHTFARDVSSRDTARIYYAQMRSELLPFDFNARSLLSPLPRFYGYVNAFVGRGRPNKLRGPKCTRSHQTKARATHFSELNGERRQRARRRWSPIAPTIPSACICARSARSIYSRGRARSRSPNALKLVAGR
jgi:hypothetical protein